MVSFRCQKNYMNIVLIYASNSDNTRQAALHIANRCKSRAFRVTAVSAENAELNDVAAADVCVLGSCTWLRDGQQGQLPEHMHRLTERLRSQPSLADKPMAVFGFGRHEYTHFCAAADELEGLVHAAGGELLLEPLRVDGYYHHNVDVVDEWASGLSRAIGGVRKKPPAQENPDRAQRRP